MRVKVTEQIFAMSQGTLATLLRNAGVDNSGHYDVIDRAFGDWFAWTQKQIDLGLIVENCAWQSTWKLYEATDRLALIGLKPLKKRSIKRFKQKAQYCVDAWRNAVLHSMAAKSPAFEQLALF